MIVYTTTTIVQYRSHKFGIEPAVVYSRTPHAGYRSNGHLGGLMALASLHAALVYICCSKDVFRVVQLEAERSVYSTDSRLRFTRCFEEEITIHTETKNA